MSYKLLLIFPPIWDASQPFLSVPSLTAYIRANGYEVIQRDLDAEFQNTITSSDYLKYLIEKKNINLEKVDPENIVKNVIENIDNAKKTLKDNKLFGKEGYFDNIEIIKNTYKIISNIYNPTKITNKSLDMKYNLKSSLHVITATQDIQENPFIDYYEKYFLSDIANIKPDIIGISITGYSQLIPALTLSRLIKLNYPNIKIVLGGFLLTLIAESLSKIKHNFNMLFDYLIVKEGEVPLLKLIQALENNSDLSEVPNLIYIDKSDVKINKEIEPLAMDNLPTPDFDGFALDKYISPKLVIPLVTSRTCYYKKCAFCSMYFDNKYQLRSIDNLVKDIRTVSEKYKTKYISFSDLTISAKTAYELAKKLIDENLNVEWLYPARFEDGYTEDVCKTLNKGGCRLLLFGMESASNRVLKFMKKGTTKEKALNIIKNTSKAGIWNHLFFMFGFPTETKEELQESLDFILENIGKTVNSIGVGTFDLEKYAPIGKNPKEYMVEEIKYNQILEDITIVFEDYKAERLDKKELNKIINDLYKEIWEMLNAPSWAIINSYPFLPIYNLSP